MPGAIFPKGTDAASASSHSNAQIGISQMRPLDIWRPGPFGMSLRMTYVETGNGNLAANFTAQRDVPPVKSLFIITSPGERRNRAPGA
jgi:hypothetical protein